MAEQVATFVKEFIDETKTKITELAQTTLENTEKKAKLDEYITAKAKEVMGRFKLGFLTKILVNKYLIGNIPTFTQYIYDLLKARIIGVTN